jgi:hypothetical protein
MVLKENNTSKKSNLWIAKLIQPELIKNTTGIETTQKIN